MKAIVLRQAGGPDNLALADLPPPAITRPGELRVRVMAAGINPVDTKMRAKPELYGLGVPGVLGCDGAGIVEDVGRGVTGFRPGDEIYYCQAPRGDRPGQYAEVAVVDARLAARKPASLSFAQAAAAPLALITAWEALHDRAALKAGQRVLVHAGAGGVGHLAIQLARLAGAAVAATVGTADKADFTRQLGAELAIRYKDSDFADAALRWTGGQGVDIAFDTVGGATFARTFPAVRVHGDLVTLLLPPADTDWTVARNRNLRVSFELMLSPWFMDIDAGIRHQGEILRAAAILFDDGKLKVHVHEEFPLARAADAHRRLAAGDTLGKLVLVTGAR
jgi:NADPH2:quinone reductase